MLEFLALHYIALLYLTIFCLRWTRSLRKPHPELGARRLRRLQRCSPMLLRRAQVHQEQCRRWCANCISIMVGAVHYVCWPPRGMTDKVHCGSYFAVYMLRNAFYISKLLFCRCARNVHSQKEAIFCVCGRAVEHLCEFCLIVFLQKRPMWSTQTSISVVACRLVRYLGELWKFFCNRRLTAPQSWGLPSGSCLAQCWICTCQRRAVVASPALWWHGCSLLPMRAWRG